MSMTLNEISGYLWGMEQLLADIVLMPKLAALLLPRINAHRVSQAEA